MTDQPACSNCNAPFSQHDWRSQHMGFCPMTSPTVWSNLYWPQGPDGVRAEKWEPHPVLSPIEQLLVNNIETIREVLDDWLSLVDDVMERRERGVPWFLAVQNPDLTERANTLRREIAELTGELDHDPIG